MGPIRLEIVGCGRISDLHELGYRDRDDARIVAVSDVKRRNARRKAEAWGVRKVFTDYAQLLADPEIDLVELLVPHHLHADMTAAACEWRSSEIGGSSLSTAALPAMSTCRS